MKVDKILPCICTPEYDSAASLYDGMPLLKVSGGKPNTYFTPFCPKCGRGGMIEYKSAYLALRVWNEMQNQLRNPVKIFVVDNCENETYNCDACVKNGDCVEQGIDGRPRWEEKQ